MESLWGDWLPCYVKALEEAKPSAEEMLILAKAEKVKANHKARIEFIRRIFMGDK